MNKLKEIRKTLIIILAILTVLFGIGMLYNNTVKADDEGGPSNPNAIMDQDYLISKYAGGRSLFARHG